SFDEPKPQPKPLPSCPSLDESLGKERGHNPPTKPHSPDSFSMKVLDHLSIHTSPSPYVVPLHPKDIYCYYHPCIVDPKKLYGFTPVLAPNGGGFILYQAYGNLYATTAFGWLLEEIQVTWAHWEKKRTRLRLYTNSLEEICIQTVETASRFLATTPDHMQDGIRILKTASECSVLKKP
nr:hypothetical protein [Tanacetum cinerariifolium]